MAKINVRSPYFVNVTATNLTQCDMELYIYEGTQTTDRGAVIYDIESVAYNESVTFEISELVRDYLDVTFDGTYTGQNIWVDYRINNYINVSPIRIKLGGYCRFSKFLQVGVPCDLICYTNAYKMYSGKYLLAKSVIDIARSSSVEWTTDAKMVMYRSV